MKQTTLLLAAFCLIAAPSFAAAQIEEIEFPRIGGIDGGAIQFSSSSSSGGRSVSVSVKDGVKTTKGKEGGEKVVIVEDPENGIKVSWTKRYGPEDADELEKTMPGLYMHLKSMPKKVDEAKVDVHVDVTRDFEADDKSDLKSKHPEVFEVYEKYTKNQGIRFGGIRRPMRLDVRPRIVDPADIRDEIEKMKSEIEEKMKEMKIRRPSVGGVAPKKDEKKEDKKESEKKEEKKDDFKKRIDG